MTKEQKRPFQLQSESGHAAKAFDTILIVCPDCNHSLHPSIEAILPDRDDYDGGKFGWSGRGELITVKMQCEGCGDFYRLLLGNHKGDCYLELAPFEVKARAASRSNECAPISI